MFLGTMAPYFEAKLHGIHNCHGQPSLLFSAGLIKKKAIMQNKTITNTSFCSWKCLGLLGKTGYRGKWVTVRSLTHLEVEVWHELLDKSS